MLQTHGSLTNVGQMYCPGLYCYLGFVWLEASLWLKHSPKFLPHPDSAAAVLLFILGILVLCEVENQFFARVLGFRKHSFSASGLSSQLWHLVSYDWCGT